MKTKMSYSETKRFLDLLFEQPTEQARDSVFRDLKLSEFTEAQFYEGIETHGFAMNLTSEQWFKIFQTYDNPFFRSRFDLSRLLSDFHLNQLTKN